MNNNNINIINNIRRLIINISNCIIEKNNNKVINELLNKLNNIDIYSNEFYYYINDILFGLFYFLHNNNYNIYYFLNFNNNVD